MKTGQRVRVTQEGLHFAPVGLEGVVLGDLSPDLSGRLLLVEFDMYFAENGSNCQALLLEELEEV